ncbi:dual specificity protein phosphatase 13A-like [Ambystoma mexicanum]|uniref:dual specificity protein phosphatase 13A-like n=1 Tax=Ambystoma mexicanum TaxID=8296 RepID=UPI0037E8F539
MSCSRPTGCSSGSNRCPRCGSPTAPTCPPPPCPRTGSTPSLCDLVDLLEGGNGPLNQEDEVWPNLYIGNAYAAMDRDKLLCMGITHILNAAHDTGEVMTDACFYKSMPIAYYGLKILDDDDFDISRFFCPAAKFIDQALRTPGGKILVHCCVTGVSRGATLVLAYLMIHKNMRLSEAICTVNPKRYIRPNDGFLNELRNLDMQC